SHRCVRRGELPCGRIAHARCVATSSTEAGCFVPACTSDAQCPVDTCEGAQKCDVPTGRCIPAQPACNEAGGEVCHALFPRGHQCLGRLSEPRDWAAVDTGPVITQPDLTLIPVPGNPGGPGSGRFVLTGALPVSALGKSGLAAVGLVVARGDRALLVDSA